MHSLPDVSPGFEREAAYKLKLVVVEEYLPNIGSLQQGTFGILDDRINACYIYPYFGVSEFDIYIYIYIYI